MNPKKINNESDKSYKIFLSDKISFLELLQSFIHEEWVGFIDEKNLELVNKSFVLRDYQERESDLIYKVKIKDREVYFYVLMELQSSIDFTMPFRLLIYMTELWKQIFLSTDKNRREQKAFQLPSIVPMVLYNGESGWTAKMSFKEYQQDYELFKDHLVDFKYLLFSINAYGDNELIEIGNLISSVFMLDKSGNIKLFIKRLKKIIKVLNKLNSDQLVSFKRWLKLIVFPKFPNDMQEIFEEILKDVEPGEVNMMVSNFSIAMDEFEEKVKSEGKAEGKVEEKNIIVKNLLRLDVDIKVIAKAAKLSVEEVLIIKDKLQN